MTDSLKSKTMSFEIVNKTKEKPLCSKVVFLKIKETILGPKYELTLNFVGETTARNLNKKYRNKNYVPNVLSFPIEKDLGEIFINIKKAKSESKEYNHTHKEHLIFLFIHGCLHLKGLDHGDKMERLEEKYLEAFSK